MTAFSVDMPMREGPRPVRLPKAVSAGFAVRRFRIVAVRMDYIECHTWDGTTEGSAITKVARPWLARCLSARDGVTYTYTDTGSLAWQKREATGAGASQMEVITQRYLAEDEIYATQSPIGGTGVDNCSWLDENRCGREWVKENPD